MLKATATQLKVQFGRFMKAVRGGTTVLVTDRGRPIARLEPIGQGRGPVFLSTVSKESPAFGAQRLPQKRILGVDAVTLLLEDRRAG